ncbi:WD repeat-containing protein 25 [Octodon degus]|uniref:WD repeat-containing protein 25 n=1 Tax=Octodon degus TaxID=10160 RepID=A0A6P6ESV4_OCTDE|nr:WD repeat-containing protein 25 [Octodon degus]
MASLVAYEDSDSEADPEPGGGGRTAGWDCWGAAAPSGTGVTSAAAQLRCQGLPCLDPRPSADARQHQLPKARLWDSGRGCSPSPRLQWPGKDPKAAHPAQAPPRPKSSSLWATCAPAAPLAAAAQKHLRSPGTAPASWAQDEATAPGSYIGPLHKRSSSEDCVVPYIPKRLRHQQAAGTELGQEPQGPPEGSAPAPLRLPPGASEVIQPHLSSPRRETRVPRTVLCQLRGHQGPVNGIQWCPVPARSQLLLSASMDRTFKVWDAVDLGRCLQTYTPHSEAVRAAQWSPCGQRILSGGFDFTLHLTDLETGTQLFSGRSDFRVTTLKFYPKDHNIFLCGGFSSEIKAWDVRTGKVVRGYKATIQQTLDILFLQEGSEFLSSTDASTRDSADRTIIAWDFRTSAKISNQIFHERYTCPSLALHPREPVFLAQTNGNYLALFSAVWPYRMSRRRRYEGHKVEGYAVGCECSPCGDLLVTGSADGRVLMFSFRTASRACTLQGHTQACVGTTYHPVLPSVLGTCSWGGDIKIWH